MRRLYRHPLSGHSHRAELFLSLLGLDFEPVEVDLLAGAQREPGFLALNPFGQVPVLDDDGTIVSDSNAILVYLATRYGAEWLAKDVEGSAAVQRWLSVAAGAIASGPAAARLVKVFGAKLDHPALLERSHALLAVMEAHLAERDWLATERATIADVAGYSYLAHAPEGGVDLGPYPNVRGWLHRIEALPGFVGMQKSPVAV
jgi:glutathione S-transferase